jgi:predicted amidohydrolase YtcJ
MRAWPALPLPFFLPLIAIAIAPLGCGGREGELPIDLILWNGMVATLDPDHPEAQAVAVRGGLITAVGSNSEILALAGPTTRRIDLQGQTVIPGLVDAHGHVLGLGNRLAELDLRGAANIETIATRVAEKARTLPAGEWVTGGGWDQNLWPGGGFPTHAPLTAAAPDHPVWLRRVDGHAAWANMKAMELAGVTNETQAPEGGSIERDAAGEPTGVFIDTAMALVADVRPAPTKEQIKASLQRGLQRCAEAGLTGVHDAGITPETVAAYRELADERKLPLRVFLMWDGTDGGKGVEPLLEQAPFVNYRDRLTLRAVKLMIDGAMGSRGAAFLNDYEDDPGNRGLLLTSGEDIERLTALALQKGYQVCTHAIGDRGVRLTLDAYEKALATVGADDPRLRIEHLQCTTREDIQRLKALNGIASMQPSHATSDMYWVEDRIGHERALGCYAWRWVLDAGVPIAAGSDFPVELERPMLGLMAAVTRQDTSRNPDGGWHPQQRMTLDEALRAYTAGAAYAAFEEGSKGRISPGMWADLTVLSENLRQIRPTSIQTVSVGYTIVGGQVIYEVP